MTESQHTPTFNMKVVVRETGLKPDTLRAWERRYGIPSPERTAGGHRLYTQHQIDLLKWLIERQDEGMTISHAVELWHSLVEQGQDPFERSGIEPPQPIENHSYNGDVIVNLRQAWLENCLKFDEYQAQQVLSQAFAQFPLETVCIELLQKSLSRVGQMWYEGDVTIQQEHFVSALAVRQVEALLSAAPRPTQDLNLIVACSPHELHTFSPLLLTLMFRRKGWHVVYLGANVPEIKLESAIQTVTPHLVVMSAQTLYTASTLVPIANMLYDMNVPMAYGGGVFCYLEKTKKHIPGHYLGDQLEFVPDFVQQLLKKKRPVDPVPTIPELCKTAASLFKRKRAAIEAHVYDKTPNVEAISAGNIQNANNELGNSIVAALELGDMGLLTANINWVQGLLINYHYRMPETVLDRYIQVYQEGVEAHLDASGQIIKDWFVRVRNSNHITNQMRMASQS
ncbi:MAG: MerR family transcriptional regulator [Chloroflexota bacterium]